MSLIKCTECGKEFSDKASYCPNCGCPTNVILNSAEGKTTYDVTDIKILRKKLLIVSRILYILAFGFLLFGITRFVSKEFKLYNYMYNMLENSYEEVVKWDDQELIDDVKRFMKSCKTLKYKFFASSFIMTIIGCGVIIYLEMSLIVCSECGKEFSNKTANCPNCGCPTETVSQCDADENNYSTLKEGDKKVDIGNETVYVSRKKMLLWICVLYALALLCFIYGITRVTNSTYKQFKSDYEFYQEYYVDDIRNDPVSAEEDKIMMDGCKSAMQERWLLFALFSVSGIILVCVGVNLQKTTLTKTKISSIS